MHKLIFVILVTTVCACSSNSTKNKNDKLQQVADVPAETVLHPLVSDTLMMELVDGKGTLIIAKKEDEGVSIQFKSGNYKKVYADLSSNDSTANIRFSQIIMPDGKMDGPFGRNITYDLPLSGTYKLLIHENMMAGDPWGGTFKLVLTLSN